MTGRPVVLLLGSPHWCRYLAEMLTRHSTLEACAVRGWRRWLRASQRRICLVGIGPADTWKRRVYYGLAKLLAGLKLCPAPTVFWIGSDVLRLTPGRTELAGLHQVAGAPWLADEVRTMDYACTGVWFPVDLAAFDVQPLPQIERLQVLCYIPDQAAAGHGGAEILAVAKRCADIDFQVMGGQGTWCEAPPPNVHFLGWVDNVRERMAAAHVILRRTPHDAYSAVVREALLSGRHVVFTYPVPGVRHVVAGDADALERELLALSDAHAAGALAVNRVPEDHRRMLTDVGAQAQALADELA